MALRPDQTPPQQTPKTPRQPGSWLRLALLAGLSLYIVILLSPFLSRLGGPARVDMSYSQLLTQIDSGNVADITIQGQSAQGDLKTSFTNNGVTN
ncbi:MAG TPA: ATP-dependent metallopeptidase FtsH/Yme1/Tma family protein, partial [Candidatus Binatus sp.]|nr:ATP-dependent metallopeptidase FtsH/Yme1/Tma family protein [Candidatus Binatus sp.]